MEFLGLAQDEWIKLGISILILALAFVLNRFVVNMLLERFARWLTSRTKTGLDDAVIDSATTPLRWLIVVVALDLVAAREAYLVPAALDLLQKIFFVLYLFVGFMFVWRLLIRVFNWYGQEMSHRTQTNIDESLLPFFRRILQVLLAFIAIIVVLDRFNVNVSGLVTTLGIGSLAVALAAQEALGDSINGFLILVDRPYGVGDRVEVLDLNTWGDVVDIGLRSTRIRTRDNRMVVVPNSVIGRSLIVNHSFPDRTYRVQVPVGVAYGTDVERARQVMIDTVRGVDGVIEDQPVQALFMEFGDSALIFWVRWWIDSYLDTRIINDRVNTAIYHALNEDGIEIPFPQRDVHHRLDATTAGQISAMLRDTKS
jgi:small-conductance mechanosensitive channel